MAAPVGAPAPVAKPVFTTANLKAAGKSLLALGTETAIAAGAGAAAAYALALPLATSAALVAGASVAARAINYCGRSITLNKYASALIQLISAVASSVLALKVAALLGYSFAKLTVIAAAWNVPYALVGASYLSGVGIPAVLALSATVLAVNLIGNQVVKAVGLAK